MRSDPFEIVGLLLFVTRIDVGISSGIVAIISWICRQLAFVAMMFALSIIMHTCYFMSAVHFVSMMLNFLSCLTNGVLLSFVVVLSIMFACFVVFSGSLMVLSFALVMLCSVYVCRVYLVYRNRKETLVDNLLEGPKVPRASILLHLGPYEALSGSEESISLAAC